MIGNSGHNIWYIQHFLIGAFFVGQKSKKLIFQKSESNIFTSWNGVNMKILLGKNVVFGYILVYLAKLYHFDFSLYQKSDIFDDFP